MYCSQCGNKMPDGSRFCPECGVSVDGGSAAPSRKEGNAKTDDSIGTMAPGPFILLLVFCFFAATVIGVAFGTGLVGGVGGGIAVIGVLIFIYVRNRS